MLNMLKPRQLGANHYGYTRQGSSELTASSPALSRGVSRNYSFSRRVPAGHTSLPQSRSRTSLLVACSTHGGLNGDVDAVKSPKQELQAHTGNNSSSPAPDLPVAPLSSSPIPRNASLPLFTPEKPIQNPQHQSWDISAELFVPSPANLPTNDDVSEPLLFSTQAIWTWTSQPGVDLFRVGSRVWNRLRQVYVILFGVDEREPEGIYSLRTFGTDGMPHETIIAFECEEEAQRYSGLLEATMDHKPYVCFMPPLELVSFCLDQTYSCRMEPKGSLLIPPDFNVTVTDWERSLRLRDGKFAVLDVEPERRNDSGAATATATAPVAAPPAAPGGGSGPSKSNPHAHPLSHPHPQFPPDKSNIEEGSIAADASSMARYTDLSTEQLQDIRARLEALFSAS